jgi:hypothetical protein
MTIQHLDAKNEWDETVSVQVIHGDAGRGIGYGPTGPVILDAGATVPPPLAGDRWMWGDGTGRYWTVNGRPDGRLQWDEMKDAPQAGSGWKLY